MIRYYDKTNERLIYIKNSANPAYWDAHWASPDICRKIRAHSSNWVSATTNKYLPKGAKILEGGCGIANHVYCLSANGYDVFGIDFAIETVNIVNQCNPELNVYIGDVRRLSIQSSSVDGYWSLGVIEHFWSGYVDIAKEAFRVLKPGGYLFLTFPALSPVRRFKAFLGCYRSITERLNEPENFYQFALHPEAVAHDFVNLGFEVVERKGMAGLKGFKDESGPLKNLLQRLYDDRSFVSKGLNVVLNFILSPFSYHSYFLILRKRRS